MMKLDVLILPHFVCFCRTSAAFPHYMTKYISDLLIAESNRQSSSDTAGNKTDSDDCC